MNNLIHILENCGCHFGSRSFTYKKTKQCTKLLIVHGIYFPIYLSIYLFIFSQSVCPFMEGLQKSNCCRYFCSVAVPSQGCDYVIGRTCGYLERRVFPEKNKVSRVFVGSQVLILSMFKNSPCFEASQNETLLGLCHHLFSHLFVISFLTVTDIVYDSTKTNHKKIGQNSMFLDKNCILNN